MWAHGNYWSTLNYLLYAGSPWVQGRVDSQYTSQVVSSFRKTYRLMCIYVLVLHMSHNPFMFHLHSTYLLTFRFTLLCTCCTFMIFYACVDVLGLRRLCPLQGYVYISMIRYAFPSLIKYSWGTHGCRMITPVDFHVLLVVWANFLLPAVFEHVFFGGDMGCPRINFCPIRIHI